MYFTLAQVEEDLSALLGGKVDVHVPKTLHPFLRDNVLGQAETLYAGA
jgi:predicted nucleotidyltransferase